MKQMTVGTLPARMLIRATDVALGYEGHTILEGIHFTVSEGEYLCIVGENGSGKSTLMKAILGLHPLAGGSLEIAGSVHAAGIGYLPQQTPAQRDFPASVMEVVLSGLLAAKGYAPFYTRADRETALSKLRLLGAEDLANRCYRELSGGQQQRVLLARALCAAGRLLLMDEPFTGLDPTVTNELYDVVDKLNHEQGVTVIMVTHDVPEALRHVSRILHLGAEHFDGTAEEYRQSPLYRRLMGGDSHA